MSAPFAWRRATGRTGTGGTLLALDCARGVYAAVDRRMPEANALTSWLTQNAAAFGLSDADLPGDPDDRGPSRRRGVPTQDWRKVDAALRKATAGLPEAFDMSADQWIAAITEALGLDPLATRILALALHYSLDKRVERLFDAISECRGGTSRLSRDPALIAMLLQGPPRRRSQRG